MPEIVCIIFVYQSADVVLEALKSIDGKVDRILCFDGRWEGYTGPDHSIDETQKIILGFSMYSKSPIFYIALSVMHQWQARTTALKYLQNGDWSIVLDADERIVEWGDDVHNILDHSNTKVFRICWSKFKPYASMPVTSRCIKKTEHLRFSTNHRRMFDEQGEIDIQHSPIIHIVIDHQLLADKKKLRTSSEEYKHWLHEYETTHWNPEDGPDPNQIKLP
jgi:hypothetical protein